MPQIIKTRRTTAPMPREIKSKESLSARVVFFVAVNLLYGEKRFVRRLIILNEARVATMWAGLVFIKFGQA